jgi:hypothetical protein
LRVAIARGSVLSRRGRSHAARPLHRSERKRLYVRLVNVVGVQVVLERMTANGESRCETGPRIRRGRARDAPRRPEPGYDAPVRLDPLHERIG